MDGSHRLNWTPQRHPLMPCAIQLSEPALERVFDSMSALAGGASRLVLLHRTGSQQ
jgi:hypothetical protein